MREYRNLMFGAAVKALESLRASAARNPAAAAVIGRVIDQFRNNPRVRQEFEPYAQLSKDAFKNIAPFVAGMVKSRLARANARGFKVEASAVAKLMKAGYRDVLNERPWPVINKIFSAAVGNRPVEIASTILPAEQLGHSEEDPRGPIASRYPQGVHGFMCHSADARNAVNLAVTQLTVKGPDGMVVLFPRGKKVTVCPVGLLPEHELAYAMTVHKSQGSEFENVMVVLPDDKEHPLLNRQIVYTGITRAKKRAVIVGSREALFAAIARKLDRDTGIRSVSGYRENFGL
jgi:hypothetical protein